MKNGFSNDTYYVRQIEKVNPCFNRGFTVQNWDFKMILRREHFKTRMPWAMTVYFVLGYKAGYLPSLPTLLDPTLTYKL